MHKLEFIELFDGFCLMINSQAYYRLPRPMVTGLIAYINSVDPKYSEELHSRQHVDFDQLPDTGLSSFVRQAIAYHEMLNIRFSITYDNKNKAIINNVPTTLEMKYRRFSPDEVTLRELLEATDKESIRIGHYIMGNLGIASGLDVMEGLTASDEFIRALAVGRVNVQL